MTAPIHLEFADLYRGSRLVVPGLTIDVPVAGPVGLIGVNGAGKSTMLMAIAGVLSPEACSLNGQLAATLRTGFVPQNHALPPWLSGAELFRLLGSDPVRVVAGLPGMHLDEIMTQRIGTLSPGQLQALAVTLALTSPTEMLVLDEPFSALDMRRRSALRAELQAMSAARQIFLSSQVGADLLEICGFLVLIRAGRVVFTGPLERLLEDEQDSPSMIDRFEKAVVRRIR